MLRSEGVYVNSADVEVLPGVSAKKLVRIMPPDGHDLIGGWALGVDSDQADVPGVRISAQLRTGPLGADGTIIVVSDEVLGDYLYRSPGRSLRGCPFSLPAPYKLDDDEALYLFIKATNKTAEPIRARANAYVWFVRDEAH